MILIIVIITRFTISITDSSEDGTCGQAWVQQPRAARPRPPFRPRRLGRSFWATCIFPRERSEKTSNKIRNMYNHLEQWYRNYSKKNAKLFLWKILIVLLSAINPHELPNSHHGSLSRPFHACAPHFSGPQWKIRRPCLQGNECKTVYVCSSDLRLFYVCLSVSVWYDSIYLSMYVCVYCNGDDA